MVSFSDMAKAVSIGASSITSTSPASKAELGAQVVSKTLEVMNQGKNKKSAGISPSFDTQMTILNAGLAQKGGIINSDG